MEDRVERGPGFTISNVRFPHERRLMQKILPPNFRAAGFASPFGKGFSLR